ncbi:LuxR family transcriptional regulator [Conexibacter sp. CPCC 206217]|uniref:helix-turn-helix transcriptional regulator n=1 Tax=Conexibacter sp. CPCC 206217 TaxID=3064574 RepID=UPI0027218731|nr:LuxR family transcriptional regulator [Conexibacter sp. CPCC 206217]MDO8209062.1 AAA family ATPase [Conexibacter sp. CPCC 206217]
METAPPLAGRDRELAAGYDLLDAIRRGRPAVLELVGDAGIGKTAVAAAVAAHAESAGIRVLRARAAAFERGVPYGLWIDLLDGAIEALPPMALDGLGDERTRELARILPALAAGRAAGGAGASAGARGPGAGASGSGAPLPPDPVSSSEARFRLHRAVGALLAALANRSPLVLVLDDLHWADPAGLELALHLLRHPPDAGVLIVLATRPGVAAGVIAEAARDVPDRAQLELEPLGDDAARTLVTGVEDPAELLTRAEGNPFFLLELARAKRRGGAIPRSIQAAVEGTVRTLSPVARDVLEGAALVGDPFELRLAEIAAGATTGRADGAIDELVEAGLVVVDPGDLRCRFRHPLVRQAVHERIALERRRAGHAALAQELRARGAGVREVAPHVAASAQPGDEDAIALLDAAALAAQAVAPDAAARWLEVAERLLPGGGADREERRLWLRLRRSLALAASGRVDDAHAVLLAVHDDLPDGSLLAVPTVVQLAQIERGSGRAHDSRARLQRALAAGLAQTPAEEAQLRVGLAVSFVQLHDRDAGAAVRDALAVAERSGSLLAVASARACTSVLASWEGDHATAAAAVERALEELEQVGDDELIQGLEIVYTLGLMAVAHERYAQADALLERAATLARRSGQDFVLAALLTFRGMTRWNLGDMPGALATVEEGIETARLMRSDATLGHALSLACSLLVRAGDRAGGERAGAEALRILATQQPDVLTATSRLNAALFMSLDADPARALRDAAAAAGPWLEQTDPSWICQLAEYLILCCLQLDDRETARGWAQRATAVAEHSRLPLALAKAASARALVLSADGDDAGALAAALEGVVRADAIGTPHRAFATSVLGRVLATAGENDAAAAELRRAASEFDACGLQRAHDAAAREIRRLGGRVTGRVGREAGVEGLAELSEREREIARLVADGAANKQIALTLHLSEKTVANHLTNIYAKLGLRGRTELAALVARAPRGD